MARNSDLRKEVRMFKTAFLRKLLTVSGGQVAGVFDFDDCIAQSSARIHLNGEAVSSAAFASTTLKDEDVVGFEEFDDPGRVINSLPLPHLWQMRAFSKRGDVYILTSRSEIVQEAIKLFLHSHGISISNDRILCVGKPHYVKEHVDVSARKRDLLKEIAGRYKEVHFYDDSHRNCKEASVLPVVCHWVGQDGTEKEI